MSGASGQFAATNPESGAPQRLSSGRAFSIEIEATVPTDQDGSPGLRVVPVPASALPHR